MKKPLRIAITTGDIDGIGLEVAIKALTRMRTCRGVQFYLWRSTRTPENDLKCLDNHFRRRVCHDWLSALKIGEDDGKVLVDIESPLSPAKWVELTAKSAMTRSIDALVTGPLSKTEIVQSGLQDLGHTGILKRVTGTKNIFMTFLGKRFNVVLLTGHISIKEAYEQINKRLLETCLGLTHQMRACLASNKKNKPIGLVGLNPHAGEKGIIDKKEIRVFQPVLKKMNNPQNVADSVLVPDVCFRKKFWKDYSFYVASYHDQGLIPFKMVHQNHPGVQVSLGLPFPRTSVDHGTAKDLFGKNKANPTSMEQAIRVAIKVLKGTPIKW